MKLVRDLTQTEIMELRQQFITFQPTGNAESDATPQIAFDLVGYTRAAFERATIQQQRFQD